MNLTSFKPYFEAAVRRVVVPSVIPAVLAAARCGDCLTVRVPEDKPTIQAAIDTPGADRVDCAQGRYRERLVIRNKSVTIAKRAGAAFCAVYFLDNSNLSIPLVAITGPGKVSFDGIEFVGGEYLGRGDSYNGSSPIGIDATDADLSFRGGKVRRFYNFMVTAVGGTFTASGLALQASDGGTSQCDIGIRLNACREVSIDTLTQEQGDIDHTIDINNTVNGLPVAFTRAQITDCRIRASDLDWGDCIRVCQDSSVVVYGCRLYRLPGGDPVTLTRLHTGVDVLKDNNEVAVRKTTFEGLPVGVYCAGEFFPIRNSHNRISVAQSDFTACELAAVALNGVQDEIIDLGGGPFKSCGNNRFTDSVAYDVMLRNSPASIHACGNSWSDPDPGWAILDHDDDLRLGAVVTDCDCPPCPDKMPPVKVPMARQVWFPELWRDEVGGGGVGPFKIPGIGPIGPPPRRPLVAVQPRPVDTAEQLPVASYVDMASPGVSVRITAAGTK